MHCGPVTALMRQYTCRAYMYACILIAAWFSNMDDDDGNMFWELTEGYTVNHNGKN